MTPDFVVLEECPEASRDGALQRLRGERRVVLGWAPASPTIVCSGVVDDVATAQAAILAAVAGARLVAVVGAERDLIDQFCDDLRSLGAVEHWVGESDIPNFTSQERDLLAHLMSGMSLGEVAGHLHISRRTADRRLAAVRSALGSKSTAEAIIAARQLGIHPAGTTPVEI